MHKILVFIVAFFPSYLFGNTLEAQTIEMIDTIYCSAFLQYVDSDDPYDKEKSHKLIKKAEQINSSLIVSYQIDVIEQRAKYMGKLVRENADKTVISKMYDRLQCDLKI